MDEPRPSQGFPIYLASAFSPSSVFTKSYSYYDSLTMTKT